MAAFIDLFFIDDSLNDLLGGGNVLKWTRFSYSSIILWSVGCFVSLGYD